MIVFRLTSKLGLSYTKEHSFGDKNIPADFTCLHVGFLRIIKPIKEEAFSKYFRMYIGDDYEWHHKVRKEVKKQSSKLEAYYKQRNGGQFKEYQNRNRQLQDEVYALKDDVRALVRAAEVITEHQKSAGVNDEVNNPTNITANAKANTDVNSIANSNTNTLVNNLPNKNGNDDGNTEAHKTTHTQTNESVNSAPNKQIDKSVNGLLDKVSIEEARTVPSEAVNDLPIR